VMLLARTLADALGHIPLAGVGSRDDGLAARRQPPGDGAAPVRRARPARV
jgi:hypothetical protein